MSKRTKSQTRRQKSNKLSEHGKTNSVDNGDFNPDYSYVIKDLKRIGILAGTFITILVILAIALP
jgi:hypothetical protein